MEDLAAFNELIPAPQAVFDGLEARSSRPRFMVPDRLSAEWQPVSWDAYANHIRAFACYLLSLHIAQGDRCAVYAGNRISWAEAALGVQAANAVLVPIYPLSTAAQARYVIGHAEVRLLVVDTLERLQGLLNLLREADELREVVLLDTLSVEDKERLQSRYKITIVDWQQAIELGEQFYSIQQDAFWQRLDSIRLDDVGLMFYTSGTTGHPKGVPLSYRNTAVNGRDWTACVHDLIDENAIDLHWLPLSHIFGFGELCLGNSLGFISYWSNPADLLTHLPEVKPHILMSVPSYWEKLALMAMETAQPEDRLLALTGGRLRFCLSGGAGLNRRFKELFYRAGLLIIEGYGLTEASPTLTLNRPDDFDFDSVGKPLPSVELKLAEDGEILARGENIFAGYHHDQQASQAAFNDEGWLCTGDIGEFTPQGFLKVIDRKKDIIVTSTGKNVAPASIERLFREDPLIDQLLIYGEGKKYLVAGVWLNEQERQRLAELRGAQQPFSIDSQVQASIERVNRGLARHQQIKRFCLMESPLSVESGLLTASLKVKRKQVYVCFKARFEQLYES